MELSSSSSLRLALEGLGGWPARPRSVACKGIGARAQMDWTFHTELAYSGGSLFSSPRGEPMIQTDDQAPLTLPRIAGNWLDPRRRTQPVSRNSRSGGVGVEGLRGAGELGQLADARNQASGQIAAGERALHRDRDQGRGAVAH